MKPLLLSSLMLLMLSCSGNPQGSDDRNLVATGMLKTRDYIITLYTSGSDQRYSVRTIDGTAVQENLTIDSMIALYPELEYLTESDNITWAGLDNNIESVRINPGALENR
jgi:hypothetical protein